MSEYVAETRTANVFGHVDHVDHRLFVRPFHQPARLYRRLYRHRGGKVLSFPENTKKG